MSWHFIEPVDVLYLRGNRLFGEPGSYGEAHIPPWPSVAAGAIRADLLARDGVDFTAFRQGDVTHDAVGTPDHPGPFRITDFGLARWRQGGLERLYPLPADLLVSRNDAGTLEIQRITPRTLSHGIQSSFPLERLPVLAQPERGKPVGGRWLTQAGWLRHLRGERPTVDELIETETLWRLDERVGVGLDPGTRRADDGKLFSVQAVDFQRDVGFAVAVDGAALPDETLLRFGGDGRGARMTTVDYRPAGIDLEVLCSTRRGRIVLTTPGLFPAGWRLPGMADDGCFEWQGVRGRVVAAAVGRSEVVSGWDLAHWRPKDAQRAAPAGSVYWIDDLEATPDQLRKLADRGLWPETDYDAQRRAEGFNRFEWGAW